MAVRIKFNQEHVPQQPTFVLANRNGNKLGTIPAVGISLRDNMNAAAELQFRVPMVENGVTCALWDDIVDFKLVWCPEWDQWFEIYVEISDGDYVEKRVSGKSVGEAELSQINLYEIEINTESDIARDDYETTVLYDPDHPNGSLLNRITEKAPHYSVGHVDASIAGLQRSFTFDSVSLLDAFNEIAKEINCLFVIDSGSNEDGGIARKINVYDLCTVCNDCGHRGEYEGICPKCGSANLTDGYGENTNIYVSVDNLTDEVGYSSNTDQVKNCFRLVGGDDLMTATIRNCNPNGSSYIWYFSDAMLDDMSDELKTALNSYNAEYDEYMSSHPYQISNYSTLRTQYNALVTKYSVYVPTLSAIPATVNGYSALMNTYYDTIDFEMLLRNTLMPSVEISRTNAAKEAAKLTTASLSPTAVTNLASCSASTASYAVQDVAKQIVDPSYQVKVETGTLTGTTWRGGITVTSYSDDEDTASTGALSVTITDDLEAYLKQRIDRILAQQSDSIVDIPTLFKADLSTFKAEIKKYCLASLNAMRDICQSCLDILVEQGIADNRTWGTNPSLYNEMYIPYLNKLNALIEEVALRENEIAIIAGAYDDKGGVLVEGMQTILQRYNEATQKQLDLNARLGTKLVNELASYRREDTYENSNYISDGLGNHEVFKRALEFIETARDEIYKSATLQHSITSTLKNLLVIKEFEPITEAFEVGNWLTIAVAEKPYRLRMLSYEIDYDNLESLSVEFSDVIETLYGRNDAASILKSASSMSTSYDAVKRQASAGQQSKNQLNGYVSQGLALTQMKIIDSAENQNVTMDHHGLLCREYLPYDTTYDGKQLKLINKGLYLTDDGWQTSKAGIGEFSYYDPEDGLEKTSYGVIADLLMSNLILSEKVGIYTKNGRIRLDQDGFTLVSCNDGTDRTVFRIQKKVGNNVVNVIYFDDNGNAHFNGNLDAAGGTFTGTLSANCIQGGTIDASSVTVKNIDASKISSGYISADRIEGGTITSAKLANAVNQSISTAQSTANGANSETQLIYISKVSGTTSVDGTTTWVTSSADTQNAWRLKRPTYNSSYPVVFVATQRKTVAGTVTCTTPIKDDTTTIIDGGHITTGTIDASKVTVTNISASNITGGTMSADKISGGTINGNNVNVTNISASNITGGTMSANRISGGTIDANDVTIKNLDASKITTGTLSASKISGGTLDASGITVIKLNSNALTSGPFAVNGNDATIAADGKINLNGDIYVNGYQARSASVTINGQTYNFHNGILVENI